MVLTKSRWWGIWPKPHTALLLREFGPLGRISVVVFWTTSDAKLLRQLHECMVRSVQEFGLNQLRAAKDVAHSEPSVALAMFSHILRPPAPQYVKRIW